MAKSFYKAQWIGNLPMCAICGGAGEGPRAEHHLTHGVSVWLCAAHRSEEFQRRRAGRDFVASLQAVWSAAGIRSKRHQAALSAHLRRIRPRPERRPRPGSYAWPLLRREAERRFSAGEHPRRVIDELRAQHADLPANTPSIRTMRRWFTQARWLTVPRATRTAPAARRTVPRSTLPPDPRASPTSRQFGEVNAAERDRPRSRAPSPLW